MLLLRCFLKVKLILSLLLITTFIQAQDGSLDLNFNPNITGQVLTTAVQPDGKILVGGGFTMVDGGTGGTTRSHIARFHADGTLDTSFNPKLLGSDVFVASIVIEPDGNILIGGLLFLIDDGTGEEMRGGIARLHPDGTLDKSFNPNVSGGFVQSIALQSDKKIIIGGQFFMVDGGTGGTERINIARLHADGSLDMGFDPSIKGFGAHVTTITVQSDGKILTGFRGSSVMVDGGTGGTARNGIARLHADGTLDTSFNPNAMNGVFAITIQSDGKLLIGGTFTTIDGGTGGTTQHLLARLHPDGTLDTGFNPNMNSTFGSLIRSIVVQPDGKIIIGGRFKDINNGVTNRLITRLNPDSSVDTDFEPVITGGFFSIVNHVIIQPNGKVLISGNFNTIDGGTGGTTRNSIALLNNPSIAPAQVAPIPTLSEWSLFIFMLLILNLSLVVLMRKRAYEHFPC
jgi:uncharacterized delta-60 repeat protein